MDRFQILKGEKLPQKNILERSKKRSVTGSIYFDKNSARDIHSLEMSHSVTGTMVTLSFIDTPDSMGSWITLRKQILGKSFSFCLHTETHTNWYRIIVQNINNELDENSFLNKITLTGMIA